MAKCPPERNAPHRRRLTVDLTPSQRTHHTLSATTRSGMGFHRRSKRQLSYGQINKSFQARHPELTKYLAAFWKAEAHFKGISVRSIPRSVITDTLAKTAANNEPLPVHILYEVLHGSAAQDTDPNAASAPMMAITTTWD
ncbi:hypothetical protein E2562_005009 [Oryza meyeriana var. granulata]|uniref:Uncharacterized protein n=1 Tax=Oryza meyeriana var. granulata TaxID=110450 RepID=A0A6G1C4D2_9ORYZ|nr:hypothetical protein E2562_005009 [Oryza meyeriana var. granulata]